MRTVLFSIANVFLALAIPLCAQQTTGTVQGRVSDASGGVIASADVELINAGTNFTMQQKTGATGNYVFNFVPPGVYTVGVRFTGFKKAEARNIAVEVNRTTTVDVVIEPGEVSQSIDVSASAEIVDTQSASVKTNVATRLIIELPSASRNPLSAAEMAPGVNVNTTGLTGGSQMIGTDGIGANVSGGRQQQNTFYLDGADNSGAYRNNGLQIPNSEAIAEIQVVTSTNSAEFGKQPGGYFNVLTKSGTNLFHGSGFYFGTNEALNANTWSRNKAGLGRAPANRKQYGGTLGGPVLHDRTFFFTSFQRYTDKATTTNSTVRFPTQQMFTGDFSAYAGQLYSPVTNEPIPGNKIPSSLIDPVSAKVVASGFFPTVAKLGDRLIWQFVTPPKNNELLGKLDHNLTQNQRVNVSTFQTWGSTNFQSGGTPTSARGVSSGRQNTTSARHTWVMTPAVVFESQFAMATHRNVSDTDKSLIGKDISDFGAKWPIPNKGGAKYYPDLEIQGPNLGPNSPQPGGGTFKQANYRFGSTGSYTRGGHNVRFGYEAQDSIVSRHDEHDATQFRFQGRFSNKGSNVFPAVADAAFAHSVADFMMGRIENFTTRGIIDFKYPAWSHYLFAQDQWRVTSRLTLNYGVRYEYYQPAKESSGRAAAFMANHQSDQFPNIPLHVAFQGDKGVQPGFVQSQKRNFAPRVGVAWDPLGSGKLAVRAGYGLFYAFPAAQIRTYSTSEFPVVPTVSGNFASLSDPWGTSTSPVFPAAPTPFPDYNTYLRTFTFTPPFTRIIGFDANFKTPRSHQWNVSVERELFKDVSLTAGYVGSRGTHLLQGIPFNYARFVNTPSGAAPNANNFQERVPYVTMNRFSIMETTGGRSWYDSLQLAGTVRKTSIMTRVTYTFTRNRGDGGGFGSFAIPDEDPTGFTTNTNNPANPKAEIGPRERRQSFRTFVVYDLPLLRGNHQLHGKLLGGWQVSGNLGVYSGNPIDVILGYDANFDAITSQPQDRPDLAKPIVYNGGSRDAKMASYFDVRNPFAAGSGSSFVKPVISASNLFGTLKRNALWGPGWWTSDLALLKNFAISERVRIQLRMEAYNWLNRANLDNPKTNMSTSDYGTILKRGVVPGPTSAIDGTDLYRNMQFGLRFIF